MDRRDFLKSGALATAASMLPSHLEGAATAQPQRIVIRTRAPGSKKIRLAERELLSGLRSLQSAREIRQSEGDSRPGDVVLVLSLDPSSFKSDQDYEISAFSSGATLRAASEQALLYSVFDFLERQGLVFGIDGTTVPIDRRPLLLPQNNQPWTASPRFAVRGLLPWPDFLNCISVYNSEDYQAYFAAMLRMRFNMFGMHVYTENVPGPLAESYLSFDFAGSGHRAALEDSTMRSWGYLPQRTSTFKMGAPQFFDRETFGADATRLSADNWDIADRTTEMMRGAFNFASELGIRTGIGFEPYHNPAEIMTALPPEALTATGGLIESRTGRALLERRLADLLERYPMIDDVWLWQDEDANWESRKEEVPLSVTPFVQAHDFLRRHAPNKKLVVSGWGFVTHHFESLHQRLPGDIIFSSLNDSLGWDPVNEAFSRLGDRERWPIPWLEDDPSMWLPQFRASRFEMDMKRAQDFGCQGVLGIHWRHRIVDPTATYLARAAWDPQLTASAHYQNFCSAMAGGDRARRLAELFNDCDSGHAIASTFVGKRTSQGYAVTRELTGDYDQAFLYEKFEADPALLEKQQATARKFQKLASEAQSPIERDRLGYFAGYVSLMVPYCASYEKAHQLGLVLDEAVKLRAAGNVAQARAHVFENGVPLWLALAPLVRETMLDFQDIIATRNGQGQLSSMQNKFVRIALERLRLSMGEFVDDLPSSVDQAYLAATTPDQANPARVFIPTRPSLLNPGQALRLFIVVPGIGPDAADVRLHLRPEGQTDWETQAAQHAGRNVYTVQLGPFSQQEGTVQYYASARSGGASSRLVDPPQAPANTYSVNLIA
ncbi:MAG TPA: twin-arginine translocation signal domain-containing protein [Acidobacteriaceae bacterium]|jgi:hypothetical protein|nr:twin-arginine translocation signal domain-containing protein [Acidobacteriaceae bacterium]